jgi:hypothetical protein
VGPKLGSLVDTSLEPEEEGLPSFPHNFVSRISFGVVVFQVRLMLSFFDGVQIKKPNKKFAH